MTARTRLYASTWAQISFRTRSGVLHRKTSICIVRFNDRRSSSAFHRSRYSRPSSSAVTAPASSSVVTTTMDRERNPACPTRTRTSRTVSDPGSGS